MCTELCADEARNALLLADAAGSSVPVEYYDGGLQTVEAGADHQIASNFVAYRGLNIGEGSTEFERYDKAGETLQANGGGVTMADCEELLNTVGVFHDGVDKLQWSVVYDLADRSGKIWQHRDSGGAWSFALPGA